MSNLKAYLSIGNCRKGVFAGGTDKIVYLSKGASGNDIIFKNLKTNEENTLLNTNEKIGDICYDKETANIFYTMDIGGNENDQVFVIKNDGSTKNLTNDFETRHYFGGVLPGGKEVVYASNARDKKSFDLVRQNVESLEKVTIIENGDNYNMPAGVSPDGSYLLYNKMLGSSDNALWMVNINTGKTVKVPSDTAVAAYHNPAWKSDSTGFYMIANKDMEYEWVGFYDIKSDTLTKIYECNWDVSDITLSHDDKYLVININEAGYSNLKILDLESNIFCNIPTPPKGVYAGFGGIYWSNEGHSIIFSVTSGKRPLDLWILDMDGDSLSKVTNSSYDGLDLNEFIEPTLGEFVSFDGLKVPYWLYVPKNKKAENLPVLIQIHGGPEGQSRPELSGNEFDQYKLNEGIAIVKPNVRGSMGYGNTYSHLDDVEKRLDSVKDIEYLVKHLIETGIADKSRIGVAGGSYGGFMTLSCIARYPDLFTCAVDTVGMFNLVTFLENTSAYRRPHRETEYGSLANHRDILLKVSPIDKVDDIKGPLMIIHGENDPRVPVSEAHQATDYLRKRGVEVELIIYDDEGHGIAKLKNRLDCYPKIVDFLKKNLNL